MVNAPAPRSPASLSDALAALCLEAETADRDLAQAMAPLLTAPAARRGWLRRLWGRLPGDGEDSSPAPDAATRLRTAIAGADARRLALAFIEAEADRLADAPARLSLIAAAREASAAEERRAGSGRRLLHELLPLRAATGS
ncbi:hypothetical protein DES42_10432 [Zavarzinia compransoris]|uniref:Uncharacterized protein n=2 Tax=Zavarzinia compransoris TaxID=1264899 RepID=A0A317E993_9PROT|nr:hypothetical protein DKG75_02545 [Zavarzinia compransoris]TDP45951.1 hypothetical protein DES42_10432 [Zavarzinia compransoris]